VSKSATPGERILGRLFPAAHGTGYPGGWSQDRISQVQHYLDWTYVVIHANCMKLSSVYPNVAWVHDSGVPGRTVKACERSLLNATGRGFGGTGHVGSDIHKGQPGKWGAKPQAPAGGDWVDYSNYDAARKLSGSNSSFLTIGEYRSKALSVLKPHEELEPIERRHLLPSLIQNPNPVDTHFDYMYELRMFKFLCGVAYEWKVRNRFGRPCERWVIPSHWVWPRTGGHKHVDPEHPDADRLIEYLEVRPWGGMGSAGMLKIPIDDVIIHLFKSPVNKLDGYSKLWSLSRWIDTEESIARSRWSQFINMARPEFWVSMPPGYTDPDDYMISRWEAKIAQKHQGEFNVGKPLFTPSGTVVTPLSFSPTDMAYMEGFDQMAKAICAGFGTPQAALGMVQDMTFGSVLATLAGWCLDDDTECLTDCGWKKCWELTDDTVVACYDQASQSMVYHKPSRIVVEPYKGPMHLWQGQRVDACMTPGHRVHLQRFPAASRKHLNYPWETIKIDDMTPATTYRIKRSAPLIGATDPPKYVSFPSYNPCGSRNIVHELDDRCVDRKVWLRFLGLYLSEGHLCDRTNGGWGICITQSEKSTRTFESVKAGILALPLKWTDKVDPRDTSCHTWKASDKGIYDYLVSLGIGSQNKRVPEEVKSWSAEDLRVLFDALMEGDGHAWMDCENTGNSSSNYKTVSKQLADDVAEIAVKCGFSATVCVQPDPRSDRKVAYRVDVSTRQEVVLSPDMRSTVEYDGTVWCVTVPTGLFFVRRNGKVHVTGNCENGLNPLLAQEGEVETKHLAKEFDEETPAWSSLTGSGHGGSGGVREARIWYDNLTPADPAQVNSDLQVDMQASPPAITTNEVRVLRGRKPYAMGGDNPWVQGPGGPMPAPVNVEEKGDDLTDLVRQYSESMAAGKDSDKLGTVESNEDLPSEEVSDSGKADDANEQAQEVEEAQADGGKIDKPNGKPSKQLVRKGWTVYKHQQTVAVDLDGTILEYDGWRGEGHFGEVRDGAREALAALRNRGWKIIVWTTRGDVQAIKDQLDGSGIEYDSINTNSDQPAGASAKVVADLYVDDRAIDGRSPWPDILAEVEQRGGEMVKQPVDKPEELYALVVQAQGELDRALQGVEGAVQVPIKSLERAEEKVERDYGGDWSRLLDVVRASVVRDTEQELRDAAEEIDGRLVLVRQKDRFAQPLQGGYRDMLRNYRTPCGMVVEVQFHLRELYDAEKRDRVYPATREMRAKALSVQQAGRWLADKWLSLESRYGRKGALAMAVGMLATMPIPGNIAAVVAVAETIRGVHGALAGKRLRPRLKEQDEYAACRQEIDKMLEGVL